MLSRTAVAPLLVLALASGACSSAKEPFLHKRHRLDYAVQDRELRDLQFYISSEVLARAENTTDPSGVIVVPAGTPGLVAEVGPNWLRIVFGAGGRGVPFVAPGGDSVYILATAVPGGTFVAVRNLDDPVLYGGDGVRYRVVRGMNAHLLIRSKDFQKLTERRTHLPGETLR